MRTISAALVYVKVLCQILLFGLARGLAEKKQVYELLLSLVLKKIDQRSPLQDSFVEFRSVRVSGHGS